MSSLLIIHTNGKCQAQQENQSSSEAIRDGSKTSSNSYDYPQPTDDRQVALNIHNRERAAVGDSPLSWSTELEQHAVNYANHLSRYGCKLQHAKGTGQGENLYAMYGGKGSLAKASKAFADEKVYYQGFYSKQVGHYTQMVWKGTKMVGCAQSTGNRCSTVVCRYYPPGNYQGQRPY